MSCPKGKLFYICFVQTEKKQRRPLNELELKTFGESSSVERIKLESGYESRIWV